MPSLLRRSRGRLAALAALIVIVALAGLVAVAQPAKKAVRSAADLPRFTYPVSGTASALLQADPATWDAFAAPVRRDLEATLAQYDITDHAALRGLLTTEMQLQVLAGEDAAAIETIKRVRALEDKPDAKLLSGLRTQVLLETRSASSGQSPDALAAAFEKNYRAALEPMPWNVVGTSLKETKSGLEIVNATLIAGQVQSDIDPAVAKSHSLSNDLAYGLIGARFSSRVLVPYKAPALAAVSAVVAAHNIVKADIWAVRDLTLTPAMHLTPVRVGIWDSGSDVALFPAQLFTDPHPGRYDRHGLAYDLENRLTHGPLYPLTPAQRRAYPEFRGYLKGFSDLQQSIDSPDASAVKRKIASLSKDQVGTFFEQVELYANYAHGTHVTGIALRGNPAARLVVGRITFDYHNVPLAPTEALSRRGVTANQDTIAYFRKHHVRVVNMSWGGTPQDDEVALEKNGIGKDAAERKAIAHKLFAIDRAGLYNAMKSAPDILFVVAAGNANSDAGFNDNLPSSFDLPNMLAVGAVDQAGDETSFTSYGKTVLVDASGYQVSSTVPGGGRVELSGTSMASPAVANLAAKLVALKPSLTPQQIIRLIRDGATTSADGRRHLIDPKRSIALLRGTAQR